MNTHSAAFIEFERNVAKVGRLNYGLRYLKKNEEEFITWLKENGEEFPNEIFREELYETTYLVLEVSNILLRSYVEDYGYAKCGNFNTFIDRYSSQINSHKMKYQRDLPPLPVLDINRDLRNRSVHSEPTYKFIISRKKPIQILSGSVLRITNDKGEKEIILLHVDKNAREAEISAAYRKMSPANSHRSSMSYGELLRDEVLECIRQIDLI